jgi:DNA-binding PadR family transcriptional regulator
LEEVLQFLLEHPGWYHGLDIVKAGVSSRGVIYVHLGRLVEQGYVEERDSPEPPVPGGLTRRQYRATGKRIPIDAEGAFA